MLALLLNRYTIAAAILLAALGGLYWYGHHAGYASGFAAEEKVYNAHIAADKAAQLAAEQAAALAQYNMAQATQAASAAYEKGKADAQAQGDSVAADLRAGNLRLQHRWAGCEASRVSNAAAAAAELDAAAADRNASAGRIVAAAKSCDEQVAGLQQILIAERAHTEAKP
jgi:hypothetical protein